MSKHTPGPWKAFGCRIEGPDGALVSGAFDGTYSPETDRETEQANANLIAAAPDLLEALERIVELVDASATEPMPTVAKIIDKARASIAKARGEQ